MSTITATDLARRTREVLDQVFGSGETVAVERNRRIIAEIVPALPQMTAAQVLLGLHLNLSPDQAQSWMRDSQQGFDQSLRDPWS